QAVEPGRDAPGPGPVGRAHLRAGGADRLVGLLGAAGALTVAARAVGEVLRAVAPADRVAGRGERLGREVHRVGAHVGDVAVLVEGLRHTHRLAGGEAELAAGLLLQ